MDESGVTMPLMASKKKPDAKPNRSPNCALFVRVEPELGNALEKYMDSLVPLRPSLTVVLKAAIKEYLARKGFWPPSDQTR